MGRPKHYYEPGMVYLITAVTYRREPVFEEPTSAQVAHDDIYFYAAKFEATSLAHIIMPDHVHWVVRPSPEDFERFVREQREKGGQYASGPHRFYLSKIIEDYKRHTSFEINRLRSTHGHKVWQDGYRDDGLRTASAIRSAVQYVILNPVKEGLVETYEEYPYLSWDADWLS